MSDKCDHDYKPAFWASDPARGGVCFYCVELSKHDPIGLNEWRDLSADEKSYYHCNGHLKPKRETNHAETFNQKTLDIMADVIKVLDAHESAEIEIPTALVAILEEITSPDPYAYSAFVPLKFVLEKYREAQIKDKKDQLING